MRTLFECNCFFFLFKRGLHVMVVLILVWNLNKGRCDSSIFFYRIILCFGFYLIWFCEKKRRRKVTRFE